MKNIFFHVAEVKQPMEKLCGKSSCNYLRICQELSNESTLSDRPCLIAGPVWEHGNVIFRTQGCVVPVES